MVKRLKKMLAAAAGILLLLPVGATAGQIKGKIQSISIKAKAIQMQDVKTEKIEVVLFGEGTRFQNASSIKDFIVDDVVVVDYEPGREARSIKRLVIEIPPEKLIDTAGVGALVKGSSTDYVLVDARPGGRYNEGHVPTAVSIPVDDFDKKKHLLPKDVSRLLVFYCGGPT